GAGSAAAVRDRGRVHDVLVVVRTHDRGLGNGRRRDFRAVDDVVVQDLCRRGADIQPGDEQGSLEPCVLAGGPRTTCLVRTEPDADDVGGSNACGGQRVDRAKDALIVAAGDDPLRDV